MQINPLNNNNIGRIGPGAAQNRPAGLAPRNFAEAAAIFAMNYVMDVRARAAEADDDAPYAYQPQTVALGDMLEGLQRVRELALISTSPLIDREEMEEVQEETNQVLEYIQNAARNTNYNNPSLADAYFATQNPALQALGIANLDFVNDWPDMDAIDNAINMVTTSLENANAAAQGQSGNPVDQITDQMSNEEAARVVEEYMHTVAAEINREIETLAREVGQQERSFSSPQPNRPEL